MNPSMRWILPTRALRSTCANLSHLGALNGGSNIDLDFMDDTAIEGYYYRPHTTALEAERIGLEVIRKAPGRSAVREDQEPNAEPGGPRGRGTHVLDTAHVYEINKEAGIGIAARLLYAPQLLRHRGLTDLIFRVSRSRAKVQ